MDWAELRKFVDALPELERDKAYLLLLVVRSRYAKETIGKHLKDTVLERAVIPYSFDWRDKLFSEASRLAFLAENTDKLYRVKGVPVPPSATGVLILLNQAKVPAAFLDFLNRVLNLAIAEQRWEEIARLEKIWFSSLHSRVKRRFHTVDLETKEPEAVALVEGALERYGGWWGRIETKRGFHYIIDVESVSEKFFTEFLRGGFRRLSEELRRVVGEGTVEYLKDSLEPLPGIPYGGFIPRFIP